MAVMITHACDRRGTKVCGSTVSGDARTNVEKYPTNWLLVTCDDCLAAPK